MTAEELKTIHSLAEELHRLSAEERYADKRKSWAAHNSLSGEGQPLLWICPDDDGGWQELVPQSCLQTVDPDLRALEWQMRKLLYHHNAFEDDYVIEPLVRFDMPGEYTGYTYGSALQTSAWGIAIQGHAATANAYHMTNYLDNPQNLERLLSHEVDFIPDLPRLEQLAEKYALALDGLVRVEFVLPYVVLVQSLLIELVHLRGLSELMYDLYDNEEMLHRILDHMSTSKVRLLDRMESSRLLFDNRTNIYTGSGGLGYLPGPPLDCSKVGLADLWGFADSQEFSEVSPQMFRTFALDYQKRGLRRFGMACYGCCEPLDNRFDMIFEALPNLRRLSVSPWSSIEAAAEAIGKRAIYSWKPNPAKICTGMDEDEICAQLQRLKTATQGRCYTEIILKDIRTCGGTPEHLQRFAALVRQVMQ